MKALKIGLWVVILLIVVVVAGVAFFLGPIIRTGVEQAGPRVLGVPVQLAKARASLLTGRVHLEGLVIGNPKGFETDHAFKVDSFQVEWAPASVLTKRVHVKSILIDSPSIMYEQTLSGNNFGALMDNLKEPEPAGEAAPTKEEEEPAPADAKEGVKVVIDTLRISNGRIGVSMPGMGSGSVPIPLPTIELTDIGKERNGASIPEVIKQVMGAIVQGVTKAVTSSGQLLGQGLKTVGQGVGAGAQQVGSAALDLGKGVGAAASDLGKGVGGAASKAASGVKNLLGGE